MQALHILRSTCLPWHTWEGLLKDQLANQNLLRYICWQGLVVHYFTESLHHTYLETDIPYSLEHQVQYLASLESRQHWGTSEDIIGLQSRYSTYSLALLHRFQ